MSKAKRPAKGRPAKQRTGGPLSRPLILVVGGAVLLAVAFFALWKASRPEAEKSAPAGAEAGGAPRLTVDREKVDLGDVPLDQTVTVTFQLANAGDETLRFSEEPTIEVAEGC